MILGSSFFSSDHWCMEFVTG